MVHRDCLVPGTGSCWSSLGNKMFVGLGGLALLCRLAVPYPTALLTCACFKITLKGSNVHWGWKNQRTFPISKWGSGSHMWLQGNSCPVSQPPQVLVLCSVVWPPSIALLWVSFLACSLRFLASSTGSTETSSLQLPLRCLKTVSH